jgi:predicted permease
MLMALFRRIRMLLAGARFDAELDEEMRLHLALREEQLRARGVSADAAEQRARRRFGNALRLREQSVDAWGWRWLEQLWQDIRIGARMLLKAPAFTAVIVATLALGIGANTAIFTLMDALAWRTLAVHDPDHLYAVGLIGENVPLFGPQRGDDVPAAFTYPQFRAMREADIADLAGYSAAAFPIPIAVELDGQPQPGLFGQLVSGNFFELLGVQPALGRLITRADDEVPGQHPVVVISHAVWRQRFGSERSVIGRRVSLDGVPFTIIGVAPASFTGLDVGQSPDVYVPMTMQSTVMPVVGDLLQQPTVNRAWVETVARLRAGTTPQQMAAALYPYYLDATSFLVRNAPVRMDARLTLQAIPYGISNLRTRFSGALRILMALVGIVLLIACANVANLLLARAAVRRQEFAVRMAMGAGRWRLARQLASEHLVLAACGALAGLLLARIATDALLAYFGSPATPAMLDATPGARVLAFVVGVSVLATIVSGLAPIRRAGGVDVASAMKRVIGRRRDGAARLQPGRLLAIAQVAFSLVLVAAGALFARSLQHLYGQDPAIPRDRILVVRVEPRGSNQRNPPRVAERLDATYTRLLQRVRAMPGVEAASLTNVSPLKPESGAAVLLPTSNGSRLRASSHVVYPGYFQTLGLRLVAGRDFSDAETGRGGSLCLVNQAFVRLAYPNDNPLGRRCFAAGVRDASHIVGVVEDARYTNIREPPGPVVYQPFLQANTGRGQMILYVRTVAFASALTASVADAVREADPTVPHYAVRTLEEEMGEVLVRDRLMATLSVLFGGLSLLLAAVGVYGLLSFGVVRRTGEIAVRMVLGAERASIVRLVMREAVLLSGIGLAIGVPLAIAAARASAATLSDLVFGVQPVDVASLVAGAVVVIVTAALAAYLPSARASRLQPISALRAEGD